MSLRVSFSPTANSGRAVIVGAAHGMMAVKPAFTSTVPAHMPPVETATFTSELQKSKFLCRVVVHHPTQLSCSRQWQMMSVVIFQVSSAGSSEAEPYWSIKYNRATVQLEHLKLHEAHTCACTCMNNKHT